MADLFMSFTSPIANIAELLLSTTSQINGGMMPNIPRRVTTASVEVRGGTQGEGGEVMPV